jgi:hypothetical protein
MAFFSLNLQELIILGLLGAVGVGVVIAVLVGVGRSKKDD